MLPPEPQWKRNERVITYTDEERRVGNGSKLKMSAKVYKVESRRMNGSRIGRARELALSSWRMKFQQEIPTRSKPIFATEF